MGVTSTREHFRFMSNNAFFAIRCVNILKARSHRVKAREKLKIFLSLVHCSFFYCSLIFFAFVLVFGICPGPCAPKDTVTVTVTLTGGIHLFDGRYLFNGHCDRQNGFHTHFARHRNKRVDGRE